MDTSSLVKFVQNLGYPVQEKIASIEELDIRPSEYEALRKASRDKFVQAVHLRREGLLAATSLWRKWLLDQYGLSKLPDHLSDLVFNLAWEQGSSSGYHSVEGYYEEYAILCKQSYDAGKKQAPIK